MFVPDDIWVWANFKESQLDYMRPGTEGDARDRRLSGTHHPRPCRERPARVRHCVLAAVENATGNYVKIVQRVPVKLVMDDPPTDVALGPGMSVVPTVRIDPAPSFLERLEAWL
jgi:membrane fusion protein, multidrug efflux system